MVTDPIILSILVATKDRYETLFSCIEGLLINYNKPQVEIIVRDNSACARSNEFIEKFKKFSCVSYHYASDPVSQTENYELGLGLVRGKFVTMIGDDDGIAGGLLEVIDWMESHSIEAFTNTSATYLWPNVKYRSQSSNNDGWLAFEERGAPELIDVAAARESVLRAGCTSLGSLPRLYYGIVSRKSLDKLKSRSGCYFPGPSPDMANAFALSFTISHLVRGNLPIFISGNSKSSNAALGLQGRHVGEIPKISFLPADTAEKWNPKIPFFWSGQTIWCQSAFTASIAMGRSLEFEAANNYINLYAKLLVWHPRFAKRIAGSFVTHHAFNNRSGMLFGLTNLAMRFFATWLQRGIKFGINRMGLSLKNNKHQEFTGLPSVLEATRKIDESRNISEIVIWLESIINSRSGNFK
jgi:glycosyltransferase involved in cell wall biosynthesis